MDTEFDTDDMASVGKVRKALLKRLIDVVAMPASRIPAQDRSVAGDILIDMLIHAGEAERSLCAKRLKDTVEAPRRLMRYLAQCRFEVAKPLLDDNKSFDDSDLVYLVRATGTQHHLAIAGRRSVSVCVCDALIEKADLNVLKALLSNPNAEISEIGMDDLILRSQQSDELCQLISRRPELRPGQAMAMFWWSDSATRKTLLTKHGADRMLIIDLCSDVFPQFTPADWEDPVARKTMQMIERRQRNRDALARSDFESLEEVVSLAAKTGMTPELMSEIGYLAGMKPISIAKLMSDLGGEGLAILCKATGLKRRKLGELWQALRRPTHTEDKQIHPQLAYVVEIYDLMSVVKAQTVLRYWNWSLTGTGLGAQADNDSNDDSSFSSAQRTKQLVLGR